MKKHLHPMQVDRIFKMRDDARKLVSELECEIFDLAASETLAKDDRKIEKAMAFRKAARELNEALNRFQKTMQNFDEILKGRSK